MGTAFQDLVVSFLPRHAKTAFIQRGFPQTVQQTLAKSCAVVSHEGAAHDFASVIRETVFCLQAYYSVNCFDLVIVHGDMVPGLQEMLVLFSLTVSGVACFVFHGITSPQLAQLRALFDTLCIGSAFTTMAPWKLGQSSWVIPVYRMS